MSCEHEGLAPYLVTGLTDPDSGTLLVSAVIEIDARVVDSDPGNGWQRWAETVWASDPDAAEEQAHAAYPAHNPDE